VFQSTEFTIGTSWAKVYQPIGVPFGSSGDVQMSLYADDGEANKDTCIQTDNWQAIPI